jgi:flagellar biosynthesis protein FliR
MSAVVADAAFAGVLVLCRVGCCLMLLPGFGSARIPMRMRLLIAVAVTATLAAFVFPQAEAAARGATESRKLALLGGEVANGVTLGLLARLHFLALQFAATLITNMIGLAATPGAPIDDLEPAPPLVTLIGMGAAMLVFAASLEYRLLGALIQSYALVGIGAPLDPGWYLDQVLRRLDVTWSLGVRLAAPFIAYAVIVNLAIGFANKFTPQISVYFIATGLVAAGGLILLWLAADDMYGVFLQHFRDFIG